ncbi:MAG TPA: DUF3160 domain-containing protein [Polyangiaceae bacterium]|nr:DUF3160 domain-containing protein [Polyangiaceae bacterium]
MKRTAQRARARHGLGTVITGVWLGSISACGSAGSGDEGGPPGSSGPDPSPLGPSTAVALSVAPAVLEPILSEVERAQSQTVESLLAASAVSFESTLGHDPTTALGLPLIQQSALALNDAELAQFAENGFVILRRKQYPSFPYGYFDIYGADLPVYVTADMVLEALHRSYDDMLQAVELADLAPRLGRLLTGMRSRLAAGGGNLSPQAAQDADFYLSVAASLLAGRTEPTVTGRDDADVRSFVTKATAAEGASEITIFDAPREIDFSQFEPRGHYAGIESLERYFRAMMWMGRIDLRMIETLGDGSRQFWRRQLETALALGALLDAAGQEDWRVIDATVGAFVGEHDYMTVPELGSLLEALGTTPAAGLGSLSDEAVAQAIIDGEYGEQRIASQIIRRMPGVDGPLPLSASFAFFGQRYTVDSHVFSNVVYGRVATRVLPNPLDAAFAAFGNDHAASLLETELTERPYAGALASMRTLVEAHPSEYWQGSLYTSWLGALRTLSARAGGGEPGSAASTDAPGLPAVARTERWARRLLNTQLGSWAELRHDTILYAKQSYTDGTACEFPDAYVEPYPEFFHAIARFAERGQSVAQDLDLEGENAPLGARIADYFSTLGRIAGTLGEMAELQRSGMPHSAEHVAFINQAIRVEGGGSGPPWQTGWYKDLFFNPEAGLELDPTIADVHTDVGGERPIARSPSVLHVGTGLPRPMVVSVDTCDGPRAYAGVVFAYHEHLEPGFSRLTDQEWLQKIEAAAPADVPWLEPVLAAP